MPLGELDTRPFRDDKKATDPPFKIKIIINIQNISISLSKYF
ncbi:hypothetical protein N568_0110755 [Lactococcus garvieae TRF1]|uniref:Uncharacterized protein n=1 Tax=Lactococcus garvieae TRF1 TaxID=1380772 RepID=V8AMS4_9LACT|nr:hypothetical protein N568_0110755 [Lactococcus garvieae TRF1]